MNKKKKDMAFAITGIIIVLEALPETLAILGFVVAALIILLT